MLIVVSPNCSMVILVVKIRGRWARGYINSVLFFETLSLKLFKNIWLKKIKGPECLKEGNGYLSELYTWISSH